MRLERTLAAAAPPEGVSPPLQALWWVGKGDLMPGPELERAHAICQAREGEREHDLVHALVHRIEGDTSNSDYWYRRAGGRFVGPDLAAEWARIAAALTR